MTVIDLLIKNAIVVTMNDERTIHPQGYVAVHDGLIKAVGAQKDCPLDTAAKVIDADGKVVLPGFVSTHTHVNDILLRGGLADDRLIYDWLFNAIYPGLAAQSQKDLEAGSSLWCMDAIRAGVTTFVDNHDYAIDRIDMSVDTCIDSYDKFGLRAIMVRQFIDHFPQGTEEYIGAIVARGPKDPLPFEVYEDTDAAMSSIEACIKRHKGRGNGRINVWGSPAVATMTSTEGWLKIKELSRKHNGKITTHTSESHFDNTRAGVSTVEFLATLGIMDSDYIAVHCTQVNDNDIRIMARTDTRIAHCIASNMFVGEGIPPLTDFHTAGILTGMGTDNATANNNINMLADMKMVALAQKGKYESAVAITAERVLEMATIEGARVLGMENEIGSLEAGKKADLNILNLSGTHLIPRHNIVSVLVYQTLGTEVETVLVDGKVLMEDRVFTLFDREEEEAMLSSIQEASDGIVERAGLEKSREWCSYKAI
ncbi:MAG: amidohydrolase family protein [Pseudomonadales bacterium]